MSEQSGVHPEKKKGIKTIQMKIVIMAALTLIAVSAIFTATSVYFIRTSTTEALQSSMQETAKVAANRVDNYLTLKRDLVSSLSARVMTLYGSQISSNYSADSAVALQNELTKMSDDFGFDLIYVIDADGMARTATHTDIASLAPEYYTSIINGNQDVYMSGVEQDKGTLGGYVINFATALKDANGQRVGVLVCKLDSNFLAELMANIRVGDNGSTFIMDDDYRCIAHTNADMMFGGSTFQSVKNDSSYTTLNALWNAMHDNTSGFQEYDYNGTRFAAYETIAGTDNWAIAVTADKAEFMAPSDSAIKYFIVIGAVLLIAAFVVVLLVLRPISGRITAITRRIEQLSKGDLTTEVPEDNANDEVSRLSAATNSLIAELYGIMDSINEALNAMADGDLVKQVSGEYPGDFQQLKSAVERNLVKLADVVDHISCTAEEVSRGSVQIADGATSLAQGASEQASSVEELHNSVRELTDRAKNIANPEQMYLDEAQEDETDDDENERVENAPALVDKLMTAMACTERQLNEIRSISTSIEQISSETGMLALNAAVEATHAGEYGKGFSVIASEIRELSEKSRQAARSADAQIDRVMQSVDRGNKVVDYTVDAVQEISASLSQIEAALAQISTVIEGTAATAEESAAGSEELSAQAEVLKELAAGFTTKQQDRPERFDGVE